MRRILFCSTALIALCLTSLTAAAEKNKEDKKAPAKQNGRRPSDVVYLLIEMSDVDTEAVEELQRLYDTLRKLDTNNEGKINADALKTAREQIVDDRVDYLMKELDTDKDGQISRDEAKGRIKEHFDRLDLDKDGYISREELRQAVAARQKAPSKD
jgi:Ca2+-binding EF-hand superfamily protein